MNKRMKAGSWANIRAFSVSLRDKDDNCDLKDSYVDDKSNSFEGTACMESVSIWDEEFGAQKSFSFSTIATQRARNANNANSESNSGDQTPMSKRRSSVKRIFGRKSTSSAALIPPARITEKSEIPRKKDKPAPTRDSVYFNLYWEALEKGLLSKEELDIWNIQGRFPNDDLRFYEGIFSVKTDDNNSSSSCSILPTSLRLAQTEDVFHSKISVGGKQDHYDGIDIPCSPAIPRKMITARATIHSISNFRYNQNRPPQPPTISTQLPGFVRLSPGLQAKFRKMAQRRQSAPSIVIRGVLGRSTKPPSALQGHDDNTVSYLPNENSQRLSLKFGNHGATLNLSKRKYVMEGKVQLTAGMQTQDRYMFLFTDLLLIAKAKSGSNFKLKYRIRVCELWTAACLEDVCELPKDKSKSFVIGWPTTNFVATFSTSESKELWLRALLKKVQEEKEQESPKLITLKIISRDSSNISHIKMLKVSHTDTAKDVVRNAVREFGFEENDDQYRLWVTSKKEGTAYPLIGHENPHAIHVNHVRDFISANGILPETEIASVAKYEHMIEPEIRDRCQFILKNCRQVPKYQIDLTRRKPSRIKAVTPSKNFFHWGRKRNGQRNESSDSGHVSGNSVGSEGTTFFPPSPPSTSPPATPKLFSLPLGQVCENAELPSPVATMFDILFLKAPYASGIFRKSPSTKLCRELRKKLNKEIDTDLEKEHIHVVAALLKDFLRQIPDSVLDCTMYDKWVGAIRNSSEVEKLRSVRRLLLSLDTCNRVLVRRLSILLNRIASRSDWNKMTAHNLALCISPSLLWPLGPSCETDAPIKVTEVTELLQYFIDHCNEIFEGIAPTDVDWPPKIEVGSDNEEEYQGDGKLNVLELAPPVSDDIATGKGFCEVASSHEKDADDESEISNFSRRRVIRRQFSRRKTGSRIDASSRILSLSQDSLDNILMDVNVDPGQHTLDDIILNESGMTGTRHIMKRGKGYVSNDSGFTTLSGEEEDITLNRSNTNETVQFHISCSAGSNANELAQTTEERFETSYSGLRRLWAPSLLNIENGQIMDDVELSEIRKEPGTEQNSSPCLRRKSQPVLLQHRRHDNGVGTDVNPPSAHIITFPEIELDESNDERTPFTVKAATYVKLNDVPSNNCPIFEAHENQEKEFMKELGNKSSRDMRDVIHKEETLSAQKKIHTSSTMITVDDVRPPKLTSHIPVTVSIHGFGRSNRNATIINPTSHGTRCMTSHGQTQSFYIGDEEDLDSTSDGRSSCREEVSIDSNDGVITFDRSCERSKTDGELYLKSSEITPITTRNNSSGSSPDAKIGVTIVKSGNIPNPRGRNVSIQRLTKHLQQIPDFKQNTCRSKDPSKDSDTLFGRNRDSSVTEDRKTASFQQNEYIAPLYKLPSQPQSDDSNDYILEIPNDMFEKALPTSFDSKTPMNSSLQNPFDRPTTDSEQKFFGSSLRSRRGSGEKRISRNITYNGDPSFSKSLPTCDWRRFNGKRLTHEEANKCDASHNIIHPAVSLASEAPPTHVMIKSSEESESKSHSSKHPLPGSHRLRREKANFNSVQSMVSVYNSTVTTTPHQNSSRQNTRVRRKAVVLTPLTKAIPRSASKHHSLPTPETDLHLTVGKTDAYMENPSDLEIHASSANTANKESINAQTSPSARFHHDQQTSSTLLYQPFSDNLPKSEYFASEDGKSPRSRTVDPLSRDNSISSSRREDARTPSTVIQINVTPEGSGRHYSVDSHVKTSIKPKLNAGIHVTTLPIRRCKDDAPKTPIKHLEPPKATKIIPRDKNANDLIPFIGIIQSEESYV